MRFLSISFLAVFTTCLLHAQTARNETINIYGGGVPGALGHTAADHPRIDVYLPANNPAQTAVLVIPGGGYHNVVDDREGAAPAQWLVQRGVAACQRAGVPVEFHMFEHGHHGVDLAEQLPALHLWTLLLESWMQQNHWMSNGGSQ
jgi:acetyl esterase/lipase